MQSNYHKLTLYRTGVYVDLMVISDVFLVPKSILLSKVPQFSEKFFLREFSFFVRVVDHYTMCPFLH